MNIINELRKFANVTKNYARRGKECDLRPGFEEQQSSSPTQLCRRLKGALHRIFRLNTQDASHMQTNPNSVEPPLPGEISIKESSIICNTSTAVHCQQPQTTDWSQFPVELLCAIFLHVLPDRTSPGDWKLDTIWLHPNRDSFLHLRGVCRRWNDAVLAPAVWNQNAVAWSVATSTKPDSRHRLACIKDYTSAVEFSPVNIISYEIGNETMTRISDEIMNTVRLAVIHCQMVRIVLPNREILDSDSIEMDSHNTETKRLRVLSWTSPYSMDDILPLRWRLPWKALRQAPWKQLTTVSLHCPLTMENCITILTENPILVTAEFEEINSSTVHSNTHPLTGPVNATLNSLKITSTVDVNILFSNVRFHNIVHLHLHLIYGTGYGALRDMNVPWGSLKTLALIYAFDLPEAYELFRQCPSLARLEWHWPGDIGRNLPTKLTTRELLELRKLENLSITVPHFYAKSLIRVLGDCIRQTRHLTLPTLPRFIWRGEWALTELETITLTNPISAQQCLSVINLSTHLRKLNVVVRDADTNTDNWPKKLVHPALRHLSLHTPVKNLQFFFDRITLPVLMTFEMIFKEDDHSAHHWAGDNSSGHYQRGLSSLIHRSRSRVRQERPMCGLALDGIAIQKADLDGIIGKETSSQTNICIGNVTLLDSTSNTDRNLFFKSSARPKHTCSHCT